MYIREKNNKFRVIPILIFYIYLIAVYPLLYQLYEENGKVGTLNKIIVFILILFIIAVFLKYFSLNIRLEEKLILLSGIYLLFSLLLFGLFGEINISDMLKEVFYSLLPLLFYFIGKNFTKKENKIFITVVYLSILFVMVIGVIDLIGVKLPTKLANAVSRKGKSNFVSYYSPMSMGYVAQLLFSLTLFDIVSFKFLKRIGFFLKYIFLIFFFVISLMTLQRSSYIGIICSVFFYLFTLKNAKKRIGFVVAIIALSFAFFLVLSLDTVEVLKFDLGQFILTEIDDISISSVLSDRSSQNIIFNDHNFFNVLFGEGFGKYSPNNSLTICKMPDVSYTRMYNELGLIGLLIFMSPYAFLLFNNFKRKNWFGVYFIIFTFFAFGFNRILWMIPLNYIIYTFFGVIENPRTIIFQNNICETNFSIVREKCVRYENCRNFL